ncbi:hypothetical protein FN846DRAFT_570943 [Sphaerosporella brunnea]|uniref:Uncharacterized protein n=1 Tax=Sphaerosporella brunnea TaxID=1250544 RepID=A0A5J5F2F7_9PEZI|nr:hypothetical protein FN846DRAFT_570943 [Sphaerosporella brunnea]
MYAICESGLVSTFDTTFLSSRYSGCFSIHHSTCVGRLEMPAQRVGHGDGAMGICSWGEPAAELAVLTCLRRSFAFLHRQLSSSLATPWPASGPDNRRRDRVSNSSDTGNRGESLTPPGTRLGPSDVLAPLTPPFAQKIKNLEFRPIAFCTYTRREVGPASSGIGLGIASPPICPHQGLFPPDHRPHTLLVGLLYPTISKSPFSDVACFPKALLSSAT